MLCPERKPRYGNEAESRGLETVKVLTACAFECQHELLEWVEQNFELLIKFGNVDIVQFFLVKLKRIPSAKDNLLKISMRTQQRSKFDLLIHYCPNLDMKERDMSLLHVAARMSW